MGKSKHVSLRLPNALADVLNYYCEAVGMSLSDFVRSAIQVELRKVGAWPPRVREK